MAINLQKITLEKKGDSHFIDLSKKENSIVEKITINLNWSKSIKSGFWNSLFSKDIDLDLGCFYELNNGDKNVIDGLQFSNGQGGDKHYLTKQGRYTDNPWIWHTGDDKSGNASYGENIIINPKGINSIKRIIVYCFIYDGVAKWKETNGVVTVNVPNNAEIEVKMGSQTNEHKFCAIAEILFTKNSINVKKLITFHSSHAECDLAYKWGLKWTAGSK